MARVITINNARTQSIETAVEELSKKDSITMTEVREFMDLLVSQKIPTGEKAKYTDPNGEEHEYDVKIPISKIYKYKSDEVEILSRTEENILNNHDFTLDFTKDVKLSDWLKELKDRSFFVARDDIPKFVSWAIRFARDIQNTCSKGEVAKTGLDTQNLQMQFNSVVKGCGKSYFTRQLVDGANELGIRARDEVPMPEARRFGTTDLESRCLVLGYKEHKPEVKVSDDVMMSVGRREKYVFEEKGKMAKNLQARAITIGSSNGFPYNKDDRTMTVIRCNSLKFQDYPEEIQKRASSVNPCNTKIYQLKSQISWISGFLNDLLEKNEFKSYINEEGQDPENQETSRLLSSYEISRLLIEVLSVIDKSLLDSISVAGLSKLYKKTSGQDLTFNQKNKIAELLTILYSKSLIQKTNYETNDLYKSYNLYKLSFIRLQDLTKEGVITALQEVENAQKTWDDVIALAEKYENENPTPPKKEDNEKPGVSSEETPAESTTFDTVDEIVEEETTTDSTLDEIADFYDGLFDETQKPAVSTFLNETEETLSTKKDHFWFKKDEYSKGSTDNTSTFVISNRVSEESIKKFQKGELPEVENPADLTARGEYLEQNNFVFECDESSLEDQKTMIENLPEEVKKCIYWVAYSGSKSIHVVLHTNNKEKDSEYRKAIWEYINKKYFHGKGDAQCYNASRLTPNPNALRVRTNKPERNGVKQQCYYMNKNPAEFDVGSVTSEVRSEKNKRDFEREFRRLNAPKDYTKKELTVETLKSRRYSPARDNAISLLEGTMSHGGDAISGLKYMLATGWDEFEVSYAVPRDTWSEKEFEGMLKAAMKNL